MVASSMLDHTPLGTLAFVESEFECIVRALRFHPFVPVPTSLTLPTGPRHPAGSQLACEPQLAEAPVYVHLFNDIAGHPLIAKLAGRQKIDRAKSCRSQKCFQNPLPSNLANGHSNILDG